MATAPLTLLLDGPLRELPARRYRGRDILLYPLDRRASIKDIIEAIGIPHTEIGAITANGRPCSFDHIPAPGECIALQALSPASPVISPTLLRPEPLPATRFLADATVRKLARLLRMAGVDTLCESGHDDAQTAERAVAEQRILLSRNRDLLRRRIIIFGHLLRSLQPEKQLVEVIRLYNLQDALKPFTRCLECNSILEPVEKHQILQRLEPLTRKYYNTFRRCPCCDKIFWQGSHQLRMRDILLRHLGPVP